MADETKAGDLRAKLARHNNNYPSTSTVCIPTRPINLLVDKLSEITNTRLIRSSSLRSVDGLREVEGPINSVGCFTFFRFNRSRHSAAESQILATRTIRISNYILTININTLDWTRQRTNKTRSPTKAHYDHRISQILLSLLVCFCWRPPTINGCNRDY